MLYIARVFGNKPPRCEYLPSKMTGGIIRQDTTSITIMCIIVYRMLPVQQRLSRVPSLCSRPSQLTGQLLKPFTQVSYQHWRCSWPSERVRLLRSSSSAVIISSTGRLVGLQICWIPGPASKFHCPHQYLVFIIALSSALSPLIYSHRIDHLHSSSFPN